MFQHTLADFYPVRNGSGKIFLVGRKIGDKCFAICVGFRVKVGLGEPNPIP